MRQRRLPGWELGTLCAGWLALMGACGHRWAITNLLWALPVPLVLVSKWLQEIRLSSRPRARRACVVIIGITVLSAAVYAATMCRYAEFKYSAPIRGSAGTLRWNDYDLARSMAGAVGAVERLTPPGSPLVMNGFTGLINFLTLHPNPSPYNFLFYPFYHTTAQEEEVVSLLERSPDVSVLLTRPPKMDEIFDRYVAQNYRCIWNNGAYFLYVRKGASRKSSLPPLFMPAAHQGGAQ